MKRFQYMILLVAVLLTACQMGAAEPTATPVPPPTDTPEPTVTPLPTDTATPIPTATPDAAATAAAQSTSEASKVLSELNKVLGESEIPYESGHLVWQQTEPVKINMQGPQATDNFVSIDENLSLKNFVMKSDVVWNASGILICGTIFRSEADLDLGKQYQFYFYRISGLPAYFIDVYKDGLFLNSITKDRFSDSLDIDNGASNQFLLVAQDNQFTVYLNGAREGRYFDNSSQRSDGYFGFLAWQQSGKGSCEFKNTWIWSLDE